MRYESEHEREVSGPLTLRTILIALGLHVAAFVFFWVMSLIIYKTPDVIIPIDMTIVPPWAEQDPDDPEPDPNPPPEEKPEPPKVEPKKPEAVEPPKVEEKAEAVEKIVEKKEKPKKEFKKSEIKQPDKKEPEKPKKKEFKKSKLIKPKKLAIKPPPNLPTGKGTARDKPLSQAEIMKALAMGATFGSSNQLAANEEQRCVSLISKRFYECWTDFNWSENLRPVLLTVKFGAGGKILGYRIYQSSGDAKVDQSVLAAAKRADHVSGLSADFLQRYPEITIQMKPKRN